MISTIGLTNAVSVHQSRSATTTSSNCRPETIISLSSTWMKSWQCLGWPAPTSTTTMRLWVGNWCQRQWTKLQVPSCLGSTLTTLKPSPLWNMFIATKCQKSKNSGLRIRVVCGEGKESSRSQPNNPSSLTSSTSNPPTSASNRKTVTRCYTPQKLRSSVKLTV